MPTSTLSGLVIISPIGAYRQIADVLATHKSTSLPVLQLHSREEGIRGEGRIHVIGHVPVKTSIEELCATLRNEILALRIDGHRFIKGQPASIREPRVNQLLPSPAVNRQGNRAFQNPRGSHQEVGFRVRTGELVEETW